MRHRQAAARAGRRQRAGRRHAEVPQPVGRDQEEPTGLAEEGAQAAGKGYDPLAAARRSCCRRSKRSTATTEDLRPLAGGAGIGVPPVFIVVCNNTSTSELVYKYISGFHRENDDGSTTLENGRLALFRNYDEYGNRLARPNTILIDCAQLESGEALDKDFREMAADEIERFRREIVERGGATRTISAPAARSTTPRCCARS